MSTLRQAAKQALEALEHGWIEKGDEVVAILRAALAQEEQEQWPVAYLWQHSETGRTRVVMPDQVMTADANWLFVGSLYTHPPRREWQGPSDAWKCACGANLYIDAEGKPRSKANG